MGARDVHLSLKIRGSVTIPSGAAMNIVTEAPQPATWGITRAEETPFPAVSTFAQFSPLIAVTDHSGALW